MELTDRQKAWMNGDHGPALQWAMTFNHGLGQFFGAQQMVPVTSAHFAPDTRLAGQAGAGFLQTLVGQGAKTCVPGYLDPCAVDFDRAVDMIARGLTDTFVEQDRKTFKLCHAMGFQPTYTCINYQTVTPPRFGEHLAWGDTGTAIAANGIFGARTNFEGGPSALASALIGYTPAYGMHLDEYRYGNLVVRIDCEPTEIADWGAIAAWSGQLSTGYDTVPVFHGTFAPPTDDMLKQLGVALASYGGHAMFHVVGITPEASTIEAACGGRAPKEEHVMGHQGLINMYCESQLKGSDVDIVAFAAPQLSADEIITIHDGLKGRRIHENTKLIINTDPQVKALLDHLGLTKSLTGLGAEISVGTCFYQEAPLMRERTGWKSVLTNSAKLVNALSSSGYQTALRKLDDCLEAATTGRLP